jgi:hypothetical protein
MSEATQDLDALRFEFRNKLFKAFFLNTNPVPEILLKDAIDAVERFTGQNPTVQATPLDNGEIEYKLYSK